MSRTHREAGRLTSQPHGGIVSRRARLRIPTRTPYYSAVAAIFPADALLTSPTRAAQRLLGAVLVHRTHDGTTSGIIVETEAYCETDPASHTFAGRTERNQIMFGRAGHAYVYFTYGIHWCFNVVTGEDGRGEAVLVRALQPLKGLALMAGRRDIQLPSESTARLLRRAEREPRVRKVLISLASGPAKLTQAMGLGGEVYGLDLVTPRGALRLLAPETPVPTRSIVASPRIGIRRATDKHWRFQIAGNPYVSRPSRVGRVSPEPQR
jgi:DNA-3-methyladenine glycosylase